MTNRTIISIIGLALCLAIFVAVNIVGQGALRGARADLTEGRLYTLSQGSRQIARRVDEPITLTLYFSEGLANSIPDIKSYSTRVREFLQEFGNASGGKIKVEVVNPEPFSEAEDKANQAGLYGAQTGRPGERIYFGLVGTNTTGQQQVIPFFDARKEDFLEYDVTRLVYLLSNPQKKTIGIMASLPINGVQDNPLMRGQDSPPWQVAAQMKELFDVKNVAPTVAEIPAGVNVLMLVHPKNLSEATQYAIDQFVMRGGKLMVFVDPWCEADVPPGINPMQAMQIPKGSDLPKLFAAWGVEMTPERFAADQDSAIKVGIGGERRQEAVNAVYYLDLKKSNKCLSSSDPVTGVLDHVTMGIAGILNKKPDATITFEPLIQTSEHAEPMDTKFVQFMPDPRKLLADFQSKDHPLTLAARISGKLKSAFPNGDPTKPAEPKEGEAKPDAAKHLAEVDKSEIIIVADCDMLTDRFWGQDVRLGGVSLGFQKFADNGDFVVMSLDNLSGTSDLSSLRARTKAARPFDRVEAIQKEAEKRYRAEEEKLQSELTRAQGKVDEILRTQTPGNSIILTPEQQAELEQSRKQVVQIRSQLRDVQHQLRQDIERLGTKLKIINVAAMPLAVGLAAIGLSIYRVNRRRSYKAMNFSF
jgi:ABC-type uncharacterized transport system involved in gliding motility auxiliary subunit